MRKLLILVVLVGLGAVFAMQKHNPSATKAEPAQLPAAPRPVSNHNWAKHALDRTAEVKKEVQRQRRENQAP